MLAASFEDDSCHREASSRAASYVRHAGRSLARLTNFTANGSATPACLCLGVAQRAESSKAMNWPTGVLRYSDNSALLESFPRSAQIEISELCIGTSTRQDCRFTMFWSICSEILDVLCAISSLLCIIPFMYTLGPQHVPRR